MTRPFDGHDGPAGITPQHGFLTPAIRRDVADLNHQFLTLALEPALFGCDYVGQVPAAKGYGTMRMYHLHAPPEKS